MSDDTTARISMVWPKSVKDAVRTKAGQRGMSDYVLEAVDRHLRDSDDLHAVERELDETKHLAQLLADRLVMGGSTSDRLEALMEVEFPHWIDTTGWPSEMAKRVRPEVAPAPEAAPIVTHVKPEEAPAGAEEPESRPQRVPEVAPQEAPPPSSLTKGAKDDFFARIMEKTGGKMDGFEGLKEQLTPASEIPKPESKPQVDRCSTCHEELVDGECWTCT